MNSEKLLDIASRSDTGRVRSHNQDNIGQDSALGVVALADGMGGHASGDVASTIAIDAVLQHLKSVIPNVAPGEIDAATGYASESLAVRQAIINANAIIYAAAEAQPAHQGMGTTLVVAIFYNNHLAVGHVGDSRLYRFRNDRLEQITVDHSLVQTLVDKGLCTQEQARTSPNKNLLTRAVGTGLTVNVDVYEHMVAPDDIYLVCSDGLNDMIDDAGISQIISTFGADLERTAEQLIVRANENGGKDNISVILVRPNKSFPASTH
jgi:serine/threonine protein phosphatase PrpC